MDALPDIMQLQVETRRKAEAIEKMVRPPLIADISLKNEPSSILPGHITYVADITNKQGMRPVFEVNPRIQELQQDIAEIQKRIKTVMFNDLFMMISNLDTVRSATEIDQRREEKMTQLGPVVERFENEAMNPLIERIFGIMKRKNLLPPMPPALQGKLLDIQYDSILSRSQKAGATASLERLLGTVGNLVGVKPDVMDNLDIDEIVREYAQYLSVSPKCMTDTKVMAQMRQQRSQQQAQQQQLQTGMALSQGAKNLSDVDVGGGVNALQAALGNKPQ
jgi:hypothetical protein